MTCATCFKCRRVFDPNPAYEYNTFFCGENIWPTTVVGDLTSRAVLIQRMSIAAVCPQYQIGGNGITQILRRLVKSWRSNRRRRA